MDKGEKTPIKVYFGNMGSHCDARVAHRHRLHQAASAGFHQLLYVTESVNHSGSNNVFLQFVTCTDAVSSMHMHKYPQNTLREVSNCMAKDRIWLMANQYHIKKLQTL